MGKNELKQTWSKCYSPFNNLRYRNLKVVQGSCALPSGIPNVLFVIFVIALFIFTIHI